MEEVSSSRKSETDDEVYALVRELFDTLDEGLDNPSGELGGTTSLPGTEGGGVEEAIFSNESSIPDDTVFFDANSTLKSDRSSSDISARIPSMHRLIDMVYESGSTGQRGLVEKVIIDQESLGRLLNQLLPGSFRSISSINFKSLDAISIKPKGVYGSRREIAKFLLDQGILDADICVFVNMLSQSDHDATSTSLLSRLYMVLSQHDAESNLPHNAFLVYWPEETTWHDDAEPAVQRNRVTFMRYLTQLSDQIIALVSKDQADAFAWEASPSSLDMSAEDEDGDNERMFVFEVQKSEDHEEDVTTSPGFKVEISQSKFANKKVELVGGEASVGLLVSALELEKVTSKPSEHNHTEMSLKSLLQSNIVLGHLDDAQLKLLLDIGLREKYQDRFTIYQKDCSAATDEGAQKLSASIRNIELQVGSEFPQIEQGVCVAWKAHIRKFQGYVDAKESSHDTRKRSTSAGRYPCIEALSKKYAAEPLERIPTPHFQNLKMRVTFIRVALGSQESAQEDFIQKALEEPLETLKDLIPDKKGWTDRIKHFGRSTFDFLTAGSGDKDPNTTSKGPQSFTEIDDLTFLCELDQLVKDRPALRDVQQKVLGALRKYLSNEEGSFVRRETRKAIESIKKLRIDQSKETIDSELTRKKRELWARFWQEIRRVTEPRGPSITRIDRIVRVHRRGQPKDTTYCVQTTHRTHHPKQTRYAFYPLKLKNADIQRLHEDAFVPQPRVQWDEAAFTFSLEEGSLLAIEYVEYLHGAHMEPNIFHYGPGGRGLHAV
ncbi:unnamed protein product [Rhizoctonia solani]|uniref:Uncharacterized protein n=1 Tax=Rhizoctonia solani TaxID=456999 RepID=A0A8H3CBF9_9AGAM|nr:unnamed protein product [Rhizoctonia solani]